VSPGFDANSDLMKTKNAKVLGLVSMLTMSFMDATIAETVVYEGDISAAANRDFFKRLQNKKVDRLVITSAGGSVKAGIELGLWVYKQQLTLEVRDYCFSSCANYVFTAAARKIIRPGAVVAWHGNYHHLLDTGLWRDDVPARMQRTGESRTTASQRVLEQVQDLVKREKKFFATISVDQYLTWIGKMPPYSARNYYFLSPADMARFGVRQVEAPKDYPNTDTSRYDVAIEFVRLNKD